MDGNRSVYAVLLFSAAALLLSIACAKSWTAVPKPSLTNSYEQCKASSIEEVQMLFVPGYDQTAILVENCSKYRRERVAIAIQTYESAWEEKFGMSEEVRKMLRTLLIGFSAEPRKVSAAYDMDGNLVTDGVLIGETMAPNMIWVHAGNHIRICDTSFVHELIHVSVWSLGFERGDPDHLGDEYAGWTHEHNRLVQDVNEKLCVLGI